MDLARTKLSEYLHGMDAEDSEALRRVLESDTPAEQIAFTLTNAGWPIGPSAIRTWRRAKRGLKVAA